jgi:hypothetical protein
MSWPEIAPQDDLPHAPADIPLWSESYFFFGYDDRAQAGIVTHMSITPFDARLWRGVLGVYLPGGELLVAKAYGREGSRDGPGAGPLAFACEEPLQRWRLRFDGAVQRVHRATLADGPLEDGPAEPLQVDLAFAATAPVYDLQQDLAGHSFASAHHQQAGRLSGTIRSGDGDLEIDTFSYRDHGFGPRDLTPVLGDAWNAVRFPSGLLMCSIDFQSTGARILRGYADDDGSYTPITPVQTPSLDGGDGTPERFELIVARGADGGGRLSITAEVLHCFTFTFAPPNDVVIGSARANPGNLHVCECPTRYQLDGETAIGLCERITRVATLGPG